MCHNIYFGKKLAYLLLSKTMTGELSVDGLLQAMTVVSSYVLDPTARQKECSMRGQGIEDY